MTRDINEITAAVRERLPDVQVYQLKVIHPADDDGVWWFSLPGIDADVQLDSTDGLCPFLVDYSDREHPAAAETVDSIEEVTRRIVEFLSSKRGRT